MLPLLPAQSQNLDSLHFQTTTRTRPFSRLIPLSSPSSQFPSRARFVCLALAHCSSVVGCDEAEILSPSRVFSPPLSRPSVARLRLAVAQIKIPLGRQ